MSGTVLVAIDLSHEADSTKILTRASQLAALDHATLNVITVMPDFGNSMVASFFDESTMAKALKKANADLHEFVDATLPGHDPTRHIVGCGNVYEEVLKAADAVSADLIVMGASKPDLTTYLLGPNAARVARHSTASVYIVR